MHDEPAANPNQTLDGLVERRRVLEERLRALEERIASTRPSASPRASDAAPLQEAHVHEVLEVLTTAIKGSREQLANAVLVRNELASEAQEAVERNDQAGATDARTWTGEVVQMINDWDASIRQFEATTETFRRLLQARLEPPPTREAG